MKVTHEISSRDLLNWVVNLSSTDYRIFFQYGGEGRNRVIFCARRDKTVLNITIYTKDEPFQAYQIISCWLKTAQGEIILGGSIPTYLGTRLRRCSFDFNQFKGAVSADVCLETIAEFP